MRRRDFLILPAAGLLARAGVGQARGEWGEMRLWYRQPAANWNEALPVGNGRLAAVVFGGVESERVQINEETVWAGERRDRTNPDGARALPEVRRLLFAGKVREAEELAEKSIIAVPKRMPPYQPLGDLLLTFPGGRGAGEYVRELDIDAGVARVVYRQGDARFTREVFASAVDQVVVIRLTCDRPGRVSFKATLKREQDAGTRAVGPDRVVLEGEAVARGGVEVDLSWAQGRATAAELRPDVSGGHKLRPPRGQRISAVTAGGRGSKLPTEPDGVVRVPLTAGLRYRVRFS
jgi:hypothetical protein